MILKKILIGTVILLSGSVAFAQHVSVTPEGGGGSRYFVINEASKNTEPLKLVIRKNLISILNTNTTLSNPKSWNISPDRSVLAAITATGVEEYEYPGKVLASVSQQAQGGNDPSLAVYPLNDGKFIMRSNIAHFDFNNSAGKTLATASNAVGTKEGEAISDVLMSPTGMSAYLINSKIKKGNSVESRIQRWDLVSGNTSAIYYGNGPIADVKLSKDGALLAIESESDGHSVITIIDGFGNEIREHSFKEKLSGYSLSGQGTDRYLTVWKGNLIRTFDVMSGKRIVYTSFQGPQVEQAIYESHDHNLVGVALTNEGKTIHKFEVFVVNMLKRQIATQNYDGSLLWDPEHLPLRITREGMGQYVVTGISTPLKIAASF